MLANFPFLSEDSEARFCLPIELKRTTREMVSAEVGSVSLNRREKQLFSLFSQKVPEKVRKTFEGLAVGKNMQKPDILQS